MRLVRSSDAEVTSRIRTSRASSNPVMPFHQVVDDRGGASAAGGRKVERSSLLCGWSNPARQCPPTAAYSAG